MLGTNKSPALRLEQYKTKQDICTMIDVNPHEGRFDNFETLPMINSKYGNSFKLEIKKNLGRKEASPSNAGHTVTID